MGEEKKKRGLRWLEFGAVIVFIIVLFIVGLPAFSKFSEYSSRSSCQNNLKQWGAIFDIYANENQGLFPPPIRHQILGQRMLRGFAAETLYPNYWTRLDYAICPSSSRGKSYLEPPIDALATDGAGEVCRSALLSRPISYVYSAYAATTTPDFAECTLLHAEQQKQLWDAEPQSYRIWRAGELAAAGCLAWKRKETASPPYESEGVTYGPYEPETLEGQSSKYEQLSSESTLRKSYPRMRKGVERFFLTDINNPTLKELSASAIGVMWDVWGEPDIGLPNLPGIASPMVMIFNHVPGGSNVLYMDGHVAYVKFQEGYPLLEDREMTQNADLIDIISQTVMPDVFMMH